MSSSTIVKVVATAAFLVCVSWIALLSKKTAILQQENATLRAEQGRIDRLAELETEVSRLEAENQRLRRIERENAEVHRLRSEVTQLRKHVVLAEQEHLGPEKQRPKLTPKAEDDSENTSVNQLSSRVFKLNPLQLASSLTALAAGSGWPTNSINEMLTEFFSAAGLEFMPPPAGGGSIGQFSALSSSESSRQGEPATPDVNTATRKVFFFNDRTGLLFIRGTEEDFDVVDSAIKTLQAAYRKRQDSEEP